MRYRLIAVDMDGTLLNDNKKITSKNLQLIKKAEDMGVKFVIASGRLPISLKYYEETISKAQPMICCNGSIILDHNRKVIYSNSINKEKLINMIDMLEEGKKVYFQFFDRDSYCCEEFSEKWTRGIYNFNMSVEKKYRIDIKILGDSKRYIKENNCIIHKLLVLDDDYEYLKRLKERFKCELDMEVTGSDINNLEILNKNVTKGEALNILSQYYKIPLEQFIAVGNGENDISMIRNSGLGVAMINAQDNIKNYADYITVSDNNNDAIAEVIEKFIL